MKNKRQISKEQTFTNVLKAAKDIIVKDGAINFLTSEVSKKAGIAHGTLFSHFPTKEALVVKIFKEELLKIATILKNFTYNEDIKLRELLNNYINLLIDDEDLFVVIAREFPFYPEEIKEEIIVTEGIIRSLLYQKIENGIKKNEYAKIDITIALSFLFGTLNYYLSRKELFEKKGQSVLANKKTIIINTFFQLLKIKNHG